VASELGRIPTWAQFNSRSGFAADTVRKRFGGTQGTYDRYRLWLEQHDRNSLLLNQLEVGSKNEQSPSPSAQDEIAAFGVTRWPRHEGVQYGAPINYRGLRHAPINEQGVVYLFGMVSHQLGFHVEAIHSGFPDCVAKRSIDSRGDRWQQVRIEFEFRSRNFVDHGHDPAGCDVIVCWLDDWPGCPLEVIELHSIIDQL
jgi:hypothetical protein